jgi:phenylacetate-coenzyme A ligase PaaK-like adenylate-forming protein
MKTTRSHWPPIRSDVPGIVWPALVQGMPATLLALLQQLDATQWWSTEQIAAAQQRQLQALLAHAHRHSPHLATRMQSAGLTIADLLNPAGFAALPLLKRADIQTDAPRLLSAQVPAAHLPLSDASSSGSTGEPVTVKRSAVNHLFWLAFTLREHLWQQRDFSGRLAAIRARLTPDAAVQHSNWGVPVKLLFDSGPGHALPINRSVREQLDWLRAVDPHYLITYPSNLAALLDEIERGDEIEREDEIERGDEIKKRSIMLPALRQIRTVGETLPRILHTRAKNLLNVGIADTYSSQEMGIIAIQCPSSGLYHIMAEGYIVEVLNADDKPCAPGEIGRLVITDLHNLAMPLLRYDTTDYAEVAAPCSCGRALPALRRIVGRERNMVSINGTRRWPLYGFDRFLEIVPGIRQYQLIQHSTSTIEVKLFCTTPPDPQQQQKLQQLICETLGHPFVIQFTLLEKRIPASPSGKFEEFMCLI